MRIHLPCLVNDDSRGKCHHIIVVTGGKTPSRQKYESQTNSGNAHTGHTTMHLQFPYMNVHALMGSDKKLKLTTTANSEPRYRHKPKFSHNRPSVRDPPHVSRYEKSIKRWSHLQPAAGDGQSQNAWLYCRRYGVLGREIEGGRAFDIEFDLNHSNLSNWTRWQ